MAPATLETVLQHLQELQQAGGVRFTATDGANRYEDWYEVHLFPPASEPEIAVAELSIRKRLPGDFERFLRASNGANLFINESALHGVGVASTELLVELQREEVEVYGSQALTPYAVFARVNGAGDFLVFELATGRVLDGVHAEQPHEWRPIAESFTQWLASFLEAEGRYYWIEALYDGAPAGSTPTSSP